MFDLDPIKEKYPMLFLTARAPGHSNLGPSLHLDLVEANRRQLLDAGTCVGENPLAESMHRVQYQALLLLTAPSRDLPGRMVSAIGIRPAFA